MKAFADLLDKLILTPSRNGKLRLMADYFANVPDPDRGWALAALTGNLSFKNAKAGLVRELISERVDPELFRWSYDFVGDLAETASLMWPEPAAKPNSPVPSLAEVVETLSETKRSDVPILVAGWFDRARPNQRYALIKLMTGGMRIGVSARLAKLALAQWSTIDVAEIEEIWHGLEPPYADLFAWLEGREERPDIEEGAIFRPPMLANPLESDDIARLDPGDYRAEWKWDGIRVQLAARRTADGLITRLYSRTGDDISHSFPDIVEQVDFEAVLDGELLVFRDGAVASFNDLQQRLNRKTVTAKMLSDAPAHIRLYDILYDGREDLRDLPFDARRQRLEEWYQRVTPDRMDVSALVDFADWDELGEIRATSRDAPDTLVEGLMLKHKASTYVAGRPKGPWFKWKRDALTMDCVLMYAQRGHGKRSSFYSDYTFGAWRDDGAAGLELVPVGKAYFGFTDEELKQLDKFVRNNTTNRFGPVREVAHGAEKGLVVEVAFDSVHESTRHKSGIAMRFPRIHRIRWDKPPRDADTVATIRKLITA
ncbi:MAG TPA: ATP-dependent DNA ligase [Rhodospirillaceae bacterium]|nr:ATP-dependent DNA ligase [Alphaproteobacteria bacterium]OUT42025.1 MAG: ATP-dependent DNA ligase [Micavibrio sp. TMED2]HCI48097.1 ATP-dependent DNA ligase [Rhodospirillaceae bacterium]MAS46372.1 ATP-dependent DNA ligase [Alphaproteobacteria bacterium]MAX95444.1 ATP-dependent DNA ligase [Alphaproteobacteria bacterium]|tara:strand:- start:3808 stop:5430 length:1623 start_codon:yes stop_codon:yes gene_type:complete